MMHHKWSFAVISFVTLFMTGHGSAHATTYYASASLGSSSNDGLSPDTPRADIQSLADVSVPGDTIMVMDGVYTGNKTVQKPILFIKNSGTSGNPITYQAYPNHHPIISMQGDTAATFAVVITGSYVNFSGFEIIGNAQDYTLSDAQAHFSSDQAAYLEQNTAPSLAGMNSTCIYSSGTLRLNINNNLVHDCSGAGIHIQSSDYVTIQNNTVYNTSWWSSYGTSGITLHYSVNSDKNQNYRNYILYNISHDNGNAVPYYNPNVGGNVPTDGHGISLDLMNTSSNNQAYIGRTLIMGNIIYNNGGGGVNDYGSNYADILNNTAFMNDKCPIPNADCGNIKWGQIYAISSQGSRIYNNILYAPATKAAYSNLGNTNVIEDYNLMFSVDGTPPGLYNYSPAIHDIIADPLVQHPSLADQSTFSSDSSEQERTNPKHSIWDLALTANSPARNQGVAGLLLPNGTNFVPKSRNGNLDTAIDIGAVSYNASQN